MYSWASFAAPARRWRRAAFALVLIMAAAGCGDDDDPSASDTSETPESTADTSALETPAIRIGYLLAETGASAAAVAPAGQVALAWSEHVNANGGINGRAVEVILADTAGDAATIQAEARRLVEDEGVIALMVTDSAVETSISEYAADQNLAIIGSSGYNTTLWGAQPNWFTNTVTIPNTILALVTGAEATGAERFGAVTCAESPACEQVSAIFEPAAESAGLQYAGLVTAPAAAVDYTAQCLTMTQEDVDFLSLLAQPAVAIRVVESCAQQGYDGSFGTGFSSFDQVMYEDLEGVSFVVAYGGFPWWIDAEPVEEFRNAVETYGPDTNIKSGIATATWSSLELFRKAASLVSGEVTMESVFDGYYALDGETLGGLLPQPMEYQPGEPAPPVPCFWLATWDPSAETPTVLQVGEPGNGASGDLASTCATS